MSVKIAGKQVKIGDRLYHSKLGWGRVEHFDNTGPAVLVVNQKPYGERKIYVRNGGKVGEDRLVFWHEPLFLDYPSADISIVQQVVDSITPLLAKRTDDV